ncbi:TonB-linked outer membrane protein, SusC/RagA family [Mariniphaga anaerophila]|uniref:TonB-linked outer membrane protein, SusC/RagA family n=1 Tax=Mariniphaga anaerophila TaxID=1484053 RepID=A0A1M5BA58_9BACT|nr:TonB-dependent receptor [Mariniphaga anaerophila]SHF39320.1 TonB-linked outer membrane protein, SusC/RagA family [Mariniphaga anaerophila]
MKKFCVTPFSRCGKAKKIVLTMKLTVFILFLSLMQVSASVYSQSTRFSFKAENKQVVEVLRQIEEQSDFRFFFLREQVDVERKVTVTAREATVEQILKEIFRGQPVSYDFANQSLIVLTRNNNPQESTGSSSESGVQQNTITGKITDASGQPLPGVTVAIKGTTHGTVTNAEGDYSLVNIPSQTTLVFSFVGMKTQEITVDGKTNINVVMEEESIGVDEVVVVGYGIQKKAHVTGSVAQISSEELMKAPKANVSSMLTGKLPGLISRQTSGQPGSDQSTIIIRGFGTFNDSSPLILVDGVERNFNTIDPNDIKSVSILKDAAAAAVYGVRAAHGVVLITTKRGSANKKATISYDGSFSFSTNTRFPKFLNGVDYAYWHNKARELDGETGYFDESDIEKIANGDPDGVLGNTDWLGSLFKDYGGTWRHNISATGGNEKVQYYVAGGVWDQSGIIPNTEYKRYNLRSNIDMDITKDIKLALNVSGRKENTINPGFSIAPNNEFSPITQAIRALPVIPREYNGLPTATGDGAATFNAVAAATQSGFNKIDRYIFESSASIQYSVPFVEGLNVKFFFAYDQDFHEQRNFLDTYNVAKYTPATGKYVVSRAYGTSEYSSLFQSASNGSRLLTRPSVEYNKKFGNHNFGALFLYEYNEGNGSSFQAQRRRFLLNAIPELSFAQEDVPNSIRGESSETQVAGYVTRLNYGFADKYLFEFAGRYDGSYKFHEDYRWGFFPSVSLGWVLSEENFFKDAFPNVDRLKIRASAGELGRDNIDAFLYKRFFNLTDTPAYAFGETVSPQYVLYSTNSVPSYNLTWEKTRTVNGGVDFVAWKGLLSFEFDAFYKYTHDILQEVGGLYPPSIANNFQTIENSGAVAAKGMELLLGHQNSIGKLHYNLSGNVSWARNKVLERTQQANIPSWQNIIGQPIGGIYGFHATGLYQTEEQLINRPTGPGGVQRLGDLMYEDLNGDGKIDYYDQKRIARSSIPEMVYSLSGDLQWKGFDASFQLQGAAICDVIISGLYPNGVMDQTEFARAFYGGGNSPYYLVENSWTPENTNARYPRLGEAWNGNNGWTSDWWVVDGSYLRLKQLTLGYTVPKRIASTMNMERLRVYVSGTNLLTWDHLDFMDPEMPSNTNGYYPQQKTFDIGVNVTF